MAAAKPQSPQRQTRMPCTVASSNFLSHFNVNDYAASMKIFAVKPR